MMCRMIRRPWCLAGLAAASLGLGACQAPTATEDEGVFAQDGVVHFRSPDAFFATVEAVGKMSPTALDAWEDRLGFVSYRRELERVMRDVMNVPTSEAADEILAANDDLV